MLEQSVRTFIAPSFDILESKYFQSKSTLQFNNDQEYPIRYKVRSIFSLISPFLWVCEDFKALKQYRSLLVQHSGENVKMPKLKKMKEV